MLCCAVAYHRLNNWQASAAAPKTIIYIDSTGGLLFAGYYVVISLYSIWYYRSVLFRDVREFLMGLLLPLVGAGTLVYVIIKSMPGTATPVKIIALVLFLVGIPLALLSKAITRAPFFSMRRERYAEEAPQPVGSRTGSLCAVRRGWAGTTRSRSTTDYDFLAAKTPDQLTFTEPVIGRS